MASFTHIAIVTVLLLFASITTARHLPELYKLGTEPTVNVSCVAKHCVELSAKCALNRGCRDAVFCSRKCFADWDKDPSPEKYIVQNCTNKCVFSYGEGKTFKDYMSCLTDNKCIAFPPIPRTCKAPNIKPIKQLATKDFNGDWWVHRGYHKVYDCWPCQKLSFHQINATAWLYSPEYETYLVNDSLLLVTDQHFAIPSSKPGGNISFVYHSVGLNHYETWWPINIAENGSWIQMYYCGTTAQWNYEGAMVLARNRTRLDTTEYDKISASYKTAVGLDLHDFCYTDTSSKCMES